MDVDTPHGPARITRHDVDTARALLVLGHGAGGGVDAPDLVVATKVAREAGISVALVEQPYRVAGRKSPAPAAQLDAAWLAVVASLGDSLPLIAGGRSSGARVACRTAGEAGAIGVVCLAFPVHPPGKPEKSRLEELDGVTVPVIVIQGESDPFGMPPDAPGRTIARVPGNHGLRGGLTEAAAALERWLPTLLT
jgi:predicted alpha/beta-hydrolase family hydrolase